MKGISWWAANAYCSGRGGLVAIESPADASSAAMFEWRNKAGGPGVVDNVQGALPTSGKEDVMMAHAGTRCRR